MQFKLLVAREMHAGQLVRSLVALDDLSERRERRPDFYFVTAGAALNPIDLSGSRNNHWSGGKVRK
jgi:hypothetical protein